LIFHKRKFTQFAFVLKMSYRSA